MRHDLEELAETMRRCSNRWILIEDKGDRGPLNMKRHRWTHETPAAFRPAGRFEFRTFRDRYADRPRFYLEGRHIHTTFPLT